ncbi:MAG: SPOR domain-containing protein [Candidatus Methylopumilus sp.]|nr:SPOR domain-containing protein [Candidatus Methylopumilus sp.]
MSRDYKPSPERSKNTSKGNPLFTGLLIGILMGVAASLGVVMFIKGGESPFAQQTSNEITKSVSEKMQDKAIADQANADAAAEAGPDGTQNRFDFYTILPGSESKVSAEEEIKIKDDAPEPALQISYYLQVGAFQTGEEADNMKAKLALQGFEAVVQTATTADKAIWHRVRVGPLTNLDQINKTKNDLLKNGFKADLIKVNLDNQ